MRRFYVPVHQLSENHPCYTREHDIIKVDPAEDISEHHRMTVRKSFQSRYVHEKAQSLNIEILILELQSLDKRLYKNSNGDSRYSLE